MIAISLVVWLMPGLLLAPLALAIIAGPPERPQPPLLARFAPPPGPPGVSPHRPPPTRIPGPGRLIRY